MNRVSTEMKTKIQTKKLILIAIFCLAIGFGFGKGEKVKAADETLGTCSYRCPGASEEIIKEDESYTATHCENFCNQTICDGKKPAECFITVDGILWDTKEYVSVAANSDKSNGTVGKIEKITATGDNSLSCNFLTDPVDCSLFTLLKLFVWLITLASTLFGWIMEPANISSILSSKAIYEGWSLVRDALNVSFIMFLLFSAFATVFQIDKYSYKNILRTLVIMALLVNFSFPISRFVIDVSNMLMYYFADTLTIGAGKADEFVTFANVSNLPSIMHPAIDKDTTSLLAAVVFVFIFMVTMLTISILFVIRTLALAVLIIFSSLAFVGTAVPPLAKHSSDWWKKLFDYSFFGPIMLFMMYIASSLMNEIQKDGLINMTKLATEDSKASDYIASLAFFSLPIIILWIGLGIAKEMSGSAGSAIVGKAQGFMKGAGKWTAMAPWRATKMVARQTGIPGGLQQKWTNWKKTGRLGSDAREARESWVAGKLGVSNALDQSQLKQIDEAKKRLNIDNLSETYLKNIVTDPNANKFEKAAARQKLAELGSATQADLDDVRKAFGATSQVFMQLANKVKLYDPVAAFSHLSAADQKINFNDFAKSNQFDAKKINSNSFGNEEFVKSLFKNKALSEKDIIDIRSKGSDYNTNLTNKITDLVNSGSYNLNTDEIHKAIQKAYTTQTGKIQNDTFADHIFEKGNKDSLARLDATALTNPQLTSFADNANSGKYKEIIQGMKNVDRKIINDHMGSAVFTAGSNGESIQNVIHNDQYLNNL